MPSLYTTCPLCGKVCSPKSKMCIKCRNRRQGERKGLPHSLAQLEKAANEAADAALAAVVWREDDAGQKVQASNLAFAAWRKVSGL
mgnify:FL=1